MKSTASTPEEYLRTLSEDRKKIMTDLRNVIKKNLPIGFDEIMSYGMLSYVIPHSIYKNGYHCDPKQPLPFMSIASQKNFVAVYHMGMYADQDLFNWFVSEFGKQSKTKPDIGKSCIRLKKMDQVPVELIGELASKLTPENWITIYERVFKK